MRTLAIPQNRRKENTQKPDGRSGRAQPLVNEHPDSINSGLSVSELALFLCAPIDFTGTAQLISIRPLTRGPPTVIAACGIPHNNAGGSAVEPEERA